MAGADFRGTARFEVRRKLGAGGMGVVYEAYDRVSRARVALKTLRSLDGESLLRLKREFRSLADVRHPNLVSLGELIADGSSWFFTMELVEGLDFLDWVRLPLREPSAGPDDSTRQSEEPRARFVEAQLREALPQLAHAVIALHASGQIHRDIKPTNLRVTPKGRLVLLDFGLVASADGVSTDRLGTPTYMAPEQIRGERVGRAADWYAVGATLYEALAGVPPFVGTDKEIVHAKLMGPPPTPPGRIAPGIPADLEALCAALLDPSPEKRPTADEVLARVGRPRTPRSPARVSAGTGFVGRRDEIASLLRAWEAASSGTCQLVAIRGESGIGKSALVGAFADRIADRGAPLVLLGRCYEQESVPFKGLDGVVDSLAGALGLLSPVDLAFVLPRDVHSLARVFPVLRRVPAVERFVDDVDPQENPARLRAAAFRGLRELFERLGERFPLLVVIEDLHWSDAESLDLLRELVDPPRAPRMLVIGTTRGSPPPPFDRALVVELAGLGPDDARALAWARAHDLRIAPPADDVLREARGHPLFIHEICAHPSAAGARTLDEALGNRLAALERESRAIVDFAAIAGFPIPLRVAARAAELSEAACAERLAALRAERLVQIRGGLDQCVEPYHDRVREAARSRLAAEQARALHAELARALEAEPDPLRFSRQLVHHLEAAGEPSRAAEQALVAARQCEESLAFELGADMLRAALRLGGFARNEERTVQLSLGRLLELAGRGPEAAQAHLDAAEGADEALRLDCQRRAAQSLLGSGHIERGLEALSLVLADLGVSLPVTLSGTVGALLWERAKLRASRLRWHERSDVPPEVLARIDMLHAVGMALWPVDQFRGVSFIAAAQNHALASGDRRRVSIALAMEAIYSGQLGDAARVDRMIAEAQEVARPLGDPALDLLLVAYSGAALYFVGRFREAEEQLWNVELFRDPTKMSAWELNVFRSMRLWALRDAGAYAELGRRYDEYALDAARRRDRYAECNFTRIAVMAMLARDQPEEALASIARTEWTPPRGEFHYPAWFELWSRANIALYRGDVNLRSTIGSELAKTPHMMMQTVQTGRARTWFARGRLALADAAAGIDRAAAIAEAEKSARRVERERVGYARVWASLLRAGVAWQRGDAEEAVRRLSFAVAEADRERLTHYGAAARRRLGELLGGDEGEAHIARSDDDLRGEQVRVPERLCAVLAPGLTRRG